MSNFVECFRLAEQDIEKGNEFIIVDDLFLPSINIKNKKYIEIEIDNTDKNNSKKIIRFNDSDRVIGFKETKVGFYKFIVNDENKSLLIDNDDNIQKEINSIINNFYIKLYRCSSC